MAPSSSYPTESSAASPPLAPTLPCQLGKLGHWARVLRIAQGTERSGSILEPRRNKGSWVGLNSSADGFKGWSGLDNGKESLDL
ncbi:unnamed protein product [Malus baccata var. baccata]